MADPITNNTSLPPTVSSPPPPPPSPEKTVERVETLLKDNGWGDSVSQDEVREVAKLIEALPKDQSGQVIQKLSDSGALEKFANESVGTSWGGFVSDGMSADERSQFFASAAKNLDAKSLGLITSAFAKVGGNNDLLKEASDAVAAHASPDTKIAYVKALAAKTTDQPTSTSYVPYKAEKTGDPEARAIATVLSSMRGTTAQAGFAQLNDKQLNAVWQAAEGVTKTTIRSERSSATFVEANAKQFSSLMDAAKSIPSASAKDAVVNAGNKVLVDSTESGELRGKSVSEMGASVLGAIKADGLARMSPDEVHALSKRISQDPATIAATQNALAAMPASPPRDALIRELFLTTSPDALKRDPKLVNATAAALANTLAPGDLNAASKIRAQLSTEDGRKLLSETTVDGTARLWAAKQAITDPAGLSKALAAGSKEERENHPWERSAIAQLYAQSNVGKYATAGVREPMLLKGHALTNTIGAAMGMPVSKSLGITSANAAEVQGRIQRGEINAYPDGDTTNNPVKLVMQGVNEARSRMGLPVDSKDALGGDVKLGMIPVQFSSKETGPISVTVYEVKSPDGKQSKFVDQIGRVYDSFEEWTTENELPSGKMTYPEGGKVGDSAATTKLVTQNTPDTVDTFGDHLKSAVDKTAMVVGIAAGVVVGAVLIGASFGTATPLVLGVAGGIAMTAGAYQAGNAAVNLHDRASHGQSIALSDPAARAAWIDVAAGALPVVGATAGRLASTTSRVLSATDEATTLASTVGYGSRLTQNASRVAVLANTAGVALDVAAVGNEGLELAMNWEKMTPEQRTQGLMSAAFWGSMTVHGAKTHIQNGGRLSEMGNIEVTLQRANIQLGGAVSAKPTLEGNAVRVTYEYKNPAKPLDSEIRNVKIEYGPKATVADIRVHQDIAQLMIGSRATQRLATQMEASINPKPGSYGAETLLEVRKHSAIVEGIQRQLANPNLTPTVRAEASAKLLDAKANQAYHETVLAGISANPTLANLPGRGYVAGAGSDAATAKGWPEPPANHHYWMQPDGEVLVRANSGHGNGQSLTFDGTNFVPTSGQPVVASRYTSAPEQVVKLNANLTPDAQRFAIDAKGLLSQREVHRAEVNRLQPLQEALRAKGKELPPAEASSLRAAYAGLTRASERIGELGAAAAIKQKYPTAIALSPTEAQILNATGPIGSGRFDQIWKVPGAGKNGADLYLVVEAKGGGAQLGTKQIGGLPYQQGHPKYFDALVEKAGPALSVPLESAKEAGNLKYLKVQTPIDVSGVTPKADVVKLKEFDLTIKP